MSCWRTDFVPALVDNNISQTTSVQSACSTLISCVGCSLQSPSYWFCENTRVVCCRHSPELQNRGHHQLCANQDETLSGNASCPLSVAQRIQQVSSNGGGHGKNCSPLAFSFYPFSATAPSRGETPKACMIQSCFYERDCQYHARQCTF
jgi:hypothetical protein